MKRKISNIIYECEYCATTFNSPKECSIHENNCDFNPHKEEKQQELNRRKERTLDIKELYNSDTIAIAEEKFIEIIKKYHNYTGKARLNLVKLNHLGKLNCYSDIENTLNYRINYYPDSSYACNHHIDMKLDNFQKIIEKLKNLKLTKDEQCKNNQFDMLDAEIEKFKSSNSQYKTLRDDLTNITEQIKNLTNKRSELNKCIDDMINSAVIKAKEEINYIEYTEIIKNLKSDLRIDDE